MKKLSVGVLSCVIAGFSVSANAGLLVDPVGKSEEGGVQVGVSYASVVTPYQGDCSDCSDETSDFKRNGFTVYGAYGLNRKMDVYAGVTYNITTEFDEDGVPDGESGFELGAGIRGELATLNSVKVVGYAQLEYISDDLGVIVDTGNPDWKDTSKNFITGMELSGGVLGLFEVNDDLALYGGLELAPLSTMELENEYSEQYLGTNPLMESRQETSSVDIKRDSLLGIRLGAKYTMDNNMFVRGEFSALSEKSFTVGAGMNF